MGKSRRNRSGAARRDPIAKTVKPPSDPELAALREAKILPVIKDLKSSDPKSIDWKVQNLYFWSGI